MLIFHRPSWRRSVYEAIPSPRLSIRSLWVPGTTILLAVFEHPRVGAAMSGRQWSGAPAPPVAQRGQHQRQADRQQQDQQVTPPPRRGAGKG
jgi:hypothetical protein